MLGTAGNFVFEALVDISETVGRFLQNVFESDQNVIHNPVKIDFCSFNLIILIELSEFLALLNDCAKFQNKNDTLVTLCEVNLERTS